MSSPPTARSIYRLHGALEDGTNVDVELTPGRYRIGNAGSADLRLPVAGVSRRHARLTLADGVLTVEDRGSTNGTWLDGTRVERATVPPGSEIRFGSVSLRVALLDDDERRLAVDLTGPGPGWQPSTGPNAGPPLASFPADDSTIVLGELGTTAADRWMACLDELVTCWQPTDPGPALGVLGTALGAAGCCLVHWADDAEPVALGVWGGVHDVPSLDDIARLAFADGTDDAGGHAFFEITPPLSIACRRLTRQATPRLGLAIWGDFPGRLGCGALLRAVVHLAERGLGKSATFAPPAASPSAPVDAKTLIFPDHYQPGTSPAMTALYRQMGRLLKGDLPVLLSGETGVGKERIARLLHASSDRADGPFEAINCAAIPSDLLEAEMFGIGKGVASGVEARRGRFQLAEGGTLFLDEIGEMPPPLQAKLLRALQEKEIHPLGNRRPLAIDVRIVSATNVDLDRQMAEGLLRPDLFFRLAGFVLDIPALRQCPEDIPGLVAHFLRRFADESAVRVRGLSVGAMSHLSAYSWPGNIRELEHEIRHLVYAADDGQVITSEWLSPRIRHPSSDPLPPVATSSSLELSPAIEALERRMIGEALERTGGVKTEACRLLGVSRNGLDKKLRRLGIEIP